MNENIRIEEVDSVEKPPRARVESPAETPSETLARKKDYLEGFLAQKPAAPSPSEPDGDLYEAVITALKEIYDPEIPVDIFELGLIYEVKVETDNHVYIDMTLTSPNCPVAESLPKEVEDKVASVDGVSSAKVNIVFDPPWDKDMMSEEAKLELGFL